MGKIPKPRKPGGIGGFGGQFANRRTHHAMRPKGGGGCAVVGLLLVGGLIAAAGLGLTATLAALT